MTLTQQAIEARHKTFLGRSTVHTFVSSSQFQLTQSALDVLALSFSIDMGHRRTQKAQSIVGPNLYCFN